MEARPTILVVDDQPENLLILEDVLGGDYAVSTASGGRQALAFLNAGNAVDLILLDVVMPGMDGFEVCRRLKSEPATQSIPVIFLTGLGEETDEEYGLGLGAEDFVRKPFSRIIVLARVRHQIKLCQASKGLRQQAEDLERTVAERTLQINRQAEALRRTRKMESLGMLTGGMAHDFANILAIISTNLQIIDCHPTVENVTEGVKAALGAVDRGTALIRRLHAFSRRQAEGIGACNLGQEIEKLQLLIAQTLPKNITLDLSIADDLWMARMDPGEFGDALINLVINATQAMPNGGTLSIEAANTDNVASIPDLPPGRFTMIAVSDNGIGIPAALLDQVFEPFFTTKERSGGSGLGLAMVYGFARRSGGNVRIYSEPGLGTTVRLYLPRAADAEVLPTAPAEAPHHGQGETILVVDDEISILTAVERHLVSIGYRVLAAANPEQALGILEGENQVALLFSDIVMPGPTDGIELARRARALRPGVGIVLSTGFAGTSGPAEFEILRKPFRLDELAAKLRSILDAVGRQG